MVEPSTITIRNARQEDIPDILRVLVDAFTPYKEKYTKEAFTHAILLDPDDVRKRIEDPSKLVIVATQEHRVIGTTTLLFQKDGQVYLQSMALLPIFQGCGIGRLILRYVETLAREKKYSRIIFVCFEPLRDSIRLYEKCGYERTGRTIPFYGETFFEMAKDLDNK